MAVKTAPEPGTIIEETKRTRTIPANSPESDAEKPWRVLGSWEYIASLSPDQWTKENLVIYLYRYDEKGNAWGIGKWTGPLDEFKVLEMFGGGRFNLKMKRGPQLIINDDFQLEGAPRTPGMNGAPALNSNGTANEGVLLTALNALIEELRAARGGSVTQDAIKSAMSLQGQVFGAGVEAVKSTLVHTATPTPAQPTAMEKLQEQLMQAMIAKMLNPTDPIETFAKMAAAVKALPGFGGGDSKSGLALELVRQIPTVTQNLVVGLQAWSNAEEARARQAALIRGAAPPINVPAAAPANHSPGNVIPMPAPQPVPSPQADAIAAAESLQKPVQPMPVETLEQMICNIVADMTLTTEQAANEACALIERASPGQTDLMTQQGEEWIWNLFQQRPILQQVANHPRLKEFISKFVELVKAAPTMQPVNADAPLA
jgi:hypothetical protein